MSVAVATTSTPPRSRALANTARAVGLVAAFGGLVAVTLLSVRIGTKPIPWSDVFPALINTDALRDLDTGHLFDYDQESSNQLIVRSLRVPRTALGLLVGSSLGIAGAVMQGVGRNPLADPGILGVNAGAALMVVVGIFVFGIGSLTGYVWLAFLGAAVASLLVYALSSFGREGATPVKLALAGAAATATLTSITTAIVLTDVNTLDEYRFWVVGSLAGRDGEVARQVLPFIGIGLLLALCSGRLLNALSLGDDVARSLGQRVGWSRAYCALVVVLLCGGATAAAGPIGFVGLTVPHVARALVGPDYRWIVPFSAVMAPMLLLGADVLGRIVARPGEVQVGIMTALVGAPFFVLLVRYRKLAEL